MILDSHIHLPALEPKDLIRSQEILAASMTAAGVDYGIVISDHLPDSPIGILSEVLDITSQSPSLFVMGTLNILKDSPTRAKTESVSAPLCRLIP
jgi:hypothetical protein